MATGLRGTVGWRVYLYGVPAMAWAVLLLVAAVAPSLGPIEDIEVIPHQDVVYHLVEYFVLALLTVLALRLGTLRSAQWVLLTAFATAAAYGVALELLQLFVPSREFSTLDLVVNVLGALLGSVAGSALLEGRRAEWAGHW